MRVLWHSNAAWAPSGYGNQTDIFTRRLQADGHEVILSTFFGLQGHTLRLDGIEILPSGLDQYGADTLPAHTIHYRPDVVVSLIDIWVYTNETLQSLPITAWSPVDHEPMPPDVYRALSACRHVWAMSRFGEREMRKAGLDPWYVPHGVDTNVFTPIDRGEARRLLGFDEDVFLVAFVGANKGFPMRKNPDVLIKAWYKFCQGHDDALLYMHTMSLPAFGGLNLEETTAFYNIPEGKLLFAEPYRLIRGDYGQTAMNLIYNAADVMVLPSSGGGFEIPLMEAQAAGCPVVTTDFSAMGELVGAGYKIPVDPFDDLKLTAQMSEQANVRPGAVLAGLEWAYEQRGNEALRRQAREFALQYDADLVYRRYMKPSLEAMAEYNRSVK